MAMAGFSSTEYLKALCGFRLDGQGTRMWVFLMHRPGIRM
jgi:hypothetical protein